MPYPVVSMPAPDIQHEIIESFEESEFSFRKNRPIVWLASLVGPLVVTAGILVLIGVFHGWDVVQKTVVAGAATFFLLGRFVILLGSDSAQSGESIEEGAGLVGFMTSGQLFIMVTYMDVMTALFVAFHLGPLFRLPWVGKKISEMVADAQFILHTQPWMRRATFLGLVLFVIFPTSTTGSIGGSIFGRLLGLSRIQTLAAIFTGSVLGNGLMYFFSEQLRPLKQMFQDSVPAQVGSIVAVIVIVVALERWFRIMKKRYIADR